MVVDSKQASPGGWIPPNGFGLVLARLAIAVIALFGAGGRLAAQTPDCVSFFTFSTTAGTGIITAPGSTPTIDNRQTACINWTMVYESTGFTGVTLTFQSADGAVTPGAMGAFSGTTITGSNPATNTTRALTTFNGYVGWFRVNLAIVGTGTLRGALYGYRNGFSPPATGPPCPGTAAVPCVVDGPDAPGVASTQNPVQVAGNDGTNVRAIRTDTSGDSVVVGPVASGSAPTRAPVLVAGTDGANTRTALTDVGGRLIEVLRSAGFAATDATGNTLNIPSTGGLISNPIYSQTFPMKFNGTTWDRDLKCPNATPIDDSSMGNTEVIALSGTTSVYICKLTLTAAAGVTIQLNQGTGVNCAGGTAALSGIWLTVSAIAEDFLADQSVLVGVAGNAVCLNLGAGTRTTGTIYWSQH